MITVARPEHLSAINNIYNQAVEEGLRTAHTDPLSLEKRKHWLRNHSSEHPVFVYLEDGNVLGWLSISPYRKDRQALDEVVEISYYVSYNHHGKGVATALMKHALISCRDMGYRILVAILVDGNEPSKKLLEKFDFREGGRIPDAIHYGNQFRDHLYMYKKLG